MHPSHLLLALITSAFGTYCFAQTGPGEDGKDGLSLQALALETYQASWWGRYGRTYFLLRSTDMVAWEYFPVIETGNNTAISYGFTSTAPNVFIRLRYEDGVYADPYELDSDGDGLTNQQELTHNTDLFSADTDADGLLDKWEIEHGFDPLDPITKLDTDGDGLPDLWETCYFPDLSRDGSGHYDSDGIVDQQEFLLGTRPDDNAEISPAIGLVIRSLN